ncbi:hypothetical protein SJX93_12100 [Streptomyces cyaneofuscatus]|uniref:hypothetical protein n=1 Tax=Streptomyces cyaneofuscatus TaxID=66883 RepID=UPI002D798D5D|nr:hypothetical protein [Streptomyces cyaneofuscatus]WRO10311.1 hypothetical protein SJX93_12100 [Streptomyces cyaneofuscatus]
MSPRTPAHVCTACRATGHPRDAMVAFTGVFGSGKSSLASEVALDLGASEK